MDEWIDAVRAELGLDATVDIDVILDVARVAAHNVARPAAPVTTFLLGMAAAGGTDVADAAGRIEALASGWPPSRVTSGQGQPAHEVARRCLAPGHHREALRHCEATEHPRSDVVDRHALAVDQGARDQSQASASG